MEGTQATLDTDVNMIPDGETLASGAAATSSSSDPPKRRVVIKKCHAVARRTWDTDVKMCSLCSSSLMIHCSRCLSDAADVTILLEVECTVVWGVCDHVFHLHCIERFLESPQSTGNCPLAPHKWEFKK